MLSAIGERINELLPANLSSYVPMFSHYTSSFVITALLFAVIYKWLPDAQIRFRDVAVGALATTVLFLIGKFALGHYFGKASLGSTYGAAGSLVLVPGVGLLLGNDCAVRRRIYAKVGHPGWTQGVARLWRRLRPPQKSSA